MDRLIPEKYKVLDNIRETEDNFTIKIDMQILHEPGQFVQVSIPGIGEAPISICSDSAEHIELNINEVGNVTRALGRLKKEDAIFIRGPYGKGYPMKQLKDNNLILVGGGSGIAPLKGVIEYVENHRADYRDMTLFLGYRSPDDIIFCRDIDEWLGKYSVKICVDKSDTAKVCYDAKIGFVTDSLKEAKISNENTVAFICGPPIMMDKSIAILKEKGFHDDQIFISAERLMYCGIGVCCHCMIKEKFACKDGPVFRYDKIKWKS